MLDVLLEVQGNGLASMLANYGQYEGIKLINSLLHTNIADEVFVSSPSNKVVSYQMGFPVLLPPS